jgi:hypothetical protein
VLDLVFRDGVGLVVGVPPRDIERRVTELGVGIFAPEPEGIASVEFRVIGQPGELDTPASRGHHPGRPVDVFIHEVDVLGSERITTLVRYLKSVSTRCVSSPVDEFSVDISTGLFVEMRLNLRRHATEHDCGEYRNDPQYNEDADSR